MKKLILTVMALGLVLSGANAYAITVDANLGDWPAAWLVNTDGVVAPGPGADYYDIEKMGIYADSTDVYFAMQTNNPLNDIHTGDLFFNFDADANYDYAVRMSNILGNSITYSLYEVIAGTLDPQYGVNLGSSPWKLVLAPGQLPLAVIVETAGFASYPVGNQPHYTIEGVLNYSLFAGAFANGFDFTNEIPARFHYTMSCGNDNGNAEWPVPEPMSMALVGTGILGLLVRRKK